jgi:DNA-binding winged helix-turn-helix (wHTH) protein
VTASFAFEQFVLDTHDRRLKAAGEPVEINGRYFDALALLVRDHGRLVSKDRFMSEVWKGVPVTDEALTQCIRTLRRQLGDNVSQPRFIETVPKHGYRFIAPVERLEGARKAQAPGGAEDKWRQFLVLGSAGTLGGVAAGVVGGLIYGFAAASQPGVGALSALLVLLCVTAFVALIGAAGVSFAIATVEFARPLSWQWTTIAGAFGGLVTGALGKLLGLDAFSLLVGRSPGDITGTMEGLLLGAAVGSAAAFALRGRSFRQAMAMGGLSGGAAGLVIAILGGRLMLGSLELLEHNYPGSRLRLEHIAQLMGETTFGPVTLAVSTTLEGALFASFVIGAMTFSRERYGTRAD